jgi:hypothetical protein
MQQRAKWTGGHFSLGFSHPAMPLCAPNRLFDEPSIAKCHLFDSGPLQSPKNVTSSGGVFKTLFRGLRLVQVMSTKEGVYFIELPYHSTNELF